MAASLRNVLACVMARTHGSSACTHICLYIYVCVFAPVSQASYGSGASTAEGGFGDDAGDGGKRSGKKYRHSKKN